MAIADQESATRMAILAIEIPTGSQFNVHHKRLPHPRICSFSSASSVSDSGQARSLLNPILVFSLVCLCIFYFFDFSSYDQLWEYLYIYIYVYCKIWGLSLVRKYWRKNILGFSYFKNTSVCNSNVFKKLILFVQLFSLAWMASCVIQRSFTRTF